MQKVFILAVAVSLLTSSNSFSTNLECYKDSDNHPHQLYVQFSQEHTFEDLDAQGEEQLLDFARQGHVGAIVSYLDLQPDNDERLDAFVEKDVSKWNNESVIIAALLYLNLYPGNPRLSKRQHKRLDNRIADFRGLYLLHLMEPKGAYLPMQRYAYASALMWFSQQAKDVLRIEDPEELAIEQFDAWFFKANLESVESKEARAKFIQLLSMRAMSAREDPDKMMFYVNAMQKYTVPDEEAQPEEDYKEDRSALGYVVAALVIPVLYVVHSIFSGFNHE